MQFHKPVFLKEVLENIIFLKKSIYIDCTLGEGGHAIEILKRSIKGSFLFGLDQDENSINLSLKKFNENNIKDYFEFIKTNFINIKKVLNFRNIFKVDGILFDLGFVANQIYSSKRGFSYKYSKNLDMRMDTSQFLTAEKILNTYSKDELIKIFIEYGEQENSEKIVNKIILERNKKPIKTTDQLIGIIKSVLINKKFFKKHPARKIFQALRIAVNNELNILEESIDSAINLLNIGGKILIISYHSLEDRIIKKCFKKNNKIKIITKKPILPSEKEILNNKQSRSAKLRIALKINE